MTTWRVISAVVKFALFNDEAVKIDRMLAGICGYLILGLFWAKLYTMYEQFFPGGFRFSDGTAVDVGDGSLLYFSLVTLSTLGYGDIIPASPWARMLASLQAVAGTLYLAVFISSLVSGLRASSRKSRGE